MRHMLRITAMASLGFLATLMLKPSPTSGSTECSLGCVATYGYDYSRDNTNPNESILKASTLTSLTHTNSPDLNGKVFAQPLYVSQISVNGGTKNVLFVATEENYVYALDADNLGNPPLWYVPLNNTGETAVPDSQLPAACPDTFPEVGITGTPAIDTGNNILYVVSNHFSSPSTFSQRLNALNLADGSAAAPALDIGSVLGSNFSAVNQNQRAGIALVSQGDTPGGPLVYVAWASYCDSSITTNGQPAYTGWVAAFHFIPGTLSGAGFFNDETSPGTEGGIWMSGAAPAVTTAPESQTMADVYLATGNGDFNGTDQYGESVLRLHHNNGSLAVTGSYTPKAWKILNNGSGTGCTSPLNMPPPYPTGTTICSPKDFDLDSGGVILVRPAGSGFLPPNDNFVALAGGKEGVFYVLDPSNMMMNLNSGADTVDPCSTGTGGQTIQCFGGIQLPIGCCTGTGHYGNRGSAAFWSGNASNPLNVLYVAGSLDTEIRAYQMAASGGGAFTTSTLFGYAPAPNPSSGQMPYPGSSPVISWNTNGGAATDAILWILDTSGYPATNRVAKLYAYQGVSSLQGGQFSLKWSDTTNGPWPTKFMVPTVIHGHVYVGGQKPVTTQQCNPQASGGCLGRVTGWN